MAIFLDNASIHRAIIVREASDRYRIPIIFNISYSPHLNGVEQYWGRVKHHYRKAVGQLKVDDVSGWINQDVVVEAMEKVSDEQASKCASIGWENLRNAEPIVDEKDTLQADLDCGMNAEMAQLLSLQHRMSKLNVASDSDHEMNE